MAQQGSSWQTSWELEQLHSQRQDLMQPKEAPSTSNTKSPPIAAMAGGNNAIQGSFDAADALQAFLQGTAPPPAHSNVLDQLISSAGPGNDAIAQQMGDAAFNQLDGHHFVPHQSMGLTAPESTPARDAGARMGMQQPSATHQGSMVSSPGSFAQHRTSPPPLSLRLPSSTVPPTQSANNLENNSSVQQQHSQRQHQITQQEEQHFPQAPMHQSWPMADHLTQHQGGYPLLQPQSSFQNHSMNAQPSGFDSHRAFSVPMPSSSTTMYPDTRQPWLTRPSFVQHGANTANFSGGPSLSTFSPSTFHSGSGFARPPMGSKVSEESMSTSASSAEDWTSSQPSSGHLYEKPWRYVDPTAPLMPEGWTGSLDGSNHANDIGAIGDNDAISRLTGVPQFAENDTTRTSTAAYSDDVSQSPSNKGVRRQGLSCDECRERHLRCDLADRIADTDGKKQGSRSKLPNSTLCSRCAEKGLECNKTSAPPVKRWPRPSRTGRRIEAARSLHGSVTSSGAAPDPAGMPNDPSPSTLEYPGLTSLQRADNRLSGSIITGALSLRLLSCFFSTAHVQLPIVDFASFSGRFNAAQGNPRVMSVMLNGGDASQGVPSMTVPFPGLVAPRWQSGESTISSPGTSETLIAAMHAWAAHYTDAPVAFGSAAKDLGLIPRSELGEASSSSSRSLTSVNIGRAGSSSSSDTPMMGATAPSNDEADGDADDDYLHLPPSKRPKRKQGVACDTCRLRRVRCDLMEIKAGGPCTRCRDKRIVCTDDYIQLKKRRDDEKLRKEQEKQLRGVSGLAPTRSDSGTTDAYWPDAEDEEASWSQLGDNPDPKQWADLPAVPAIFVGSTRVPSLTAFGKAREAFCHDLLTRAVVLVHKHQLLRKASVEAVQALVLLVQLFDLIDPSFASEMTAAASSHLRALGLQSSEEIDETDRRAVEKLFNHMQAKRVWCSTWTRDALATTIYRRLPNFVEERAIRIGASRQQSSSGSNSATTRPPELTPEMGLSFSVMALMQLGVLSRFVTKHIDGIQGDTLLPPQERFPVLPTSGDNRKLAKATHAVWKSSDSLLAFFDRCTIKAWNQMEALKIFQPKVWIASVKMTSSMLLLSVSRILGERHRMNASYLQAISKAHGAHVISASDRNESQALRELFEQSCQRAVISCRKMARLTEKLLQKPSLTFQTGGILLRQLFAVAQYLARTAAEEPNAPPSFDPSAAVSGAAWTQSDRHAWDHSSSSKIGGPSSSPASMPRSAATATVPPPQPASVNPAALSISSAGTFIPTVQPEAPPSPSELVSLAMDYDSPLPPFTAEQKTREVNACLEALDQLGFAWSMEEEIESVKRVMRGERGKRMGYVLA